jgi:trigger factor
VVAGFLSNAKMPGFRKGKAPRPMVERRFDGEIREDLQDRLLHRVWNDVVGRDEVRPASDRLRIEGDWKEDGSYEVKGDVEVFPEVEVKNLAGFTPPEFDLEPNGEEIDTALTRLRERQGAWEPVEDGTIDDDLLVEAEVHGSVPDGGGEPFSEERSLFRIGAGEVFAEIEAAVRGKKVGAEVTAERVLGEEAGEERKGTRVAYDIKVKGIRRRQLPELDDEFAKSLGVEEGLDTLRERVTQQIRLEKAHLRRDVWRSALVRHLADDKELPLPESLVNEETRKELISFAQSLAARGLDPEKAEVDWEELQRDARSKVEERLRAELLLDAAAAELGVEVSEEDVDTELQRQAARMSVPFAELKGNLAKGAGLGRVRSMLRRERAVDQVLGRTTGGAEASATGEEPAAEGE